MTAQTELLRDQLDRELTAHLSFWRGGGSNGPKSQHADRGVYIHNAGPSTAHLFELWFEDEETGERSPITRHAVVSAGEKLSSPIRVNLGTALNDGKPGTLRLWAKWSDGKGENEPVMTDCTAPRTY